MKQSPLFSEAFLFFFFPSPKHRNPGASESHGANPGREQQPGLGATSKKFFGHFFGFTFPMQDEGPFGFVLGSRNSSGYPEPQQGKGRFHWLTFRLSLFFFFPGIFILQEDRPGWGEASHPSGFLGKGGNGHTWRFFWQGNHSILMDLFPGVGLDPVGHSGIVPDKRGL